MSKPPAPVNFDALDAPPDDTWKSRLTDETSINWEALAEREGKGMGTLPKVETPEEPLDGVGHEDPAVLSMAKSAFNWFASPVPADPQEEVEKPAPAAVKKPAPRKPAAKTAAKTVKKPIPRKPAVRRKPGTANKPVPIPKDVKERERYIRMYRDFADRFELNDDIMTKTTKQLGKMTLEDLKRQYGLLKAKSNQGTVEAMCYDIFEELIKMGGKLYTKYLKRHALFGSLYGNVEFVYLDEILARALDDEEGDPALKAALAEAAIELAEWLCQPWYYRLLYHSHKIYGLAASLETQRRARVVSDQPMTAAGRAVFDSLGLDKS